MFIARRALKCGECQRELGHHSWITRAGDKGALFLSCADLDHLVFLPAGDAALTRRAQKHSRLSAVVLEWSRARKRYERQGLLVEEEALAQAEAECLADAEARARRPSGPGWTGSTSNNSRRGSGSCIHPAPTGGSGPSLNTPA